MGITEQQLNNILYKAYEIFMHRHQSGVAAKEELLAWIKGYLTVDRVTAVVIMSEILTTCSWRLKNERI